MLQDEDYPRPDQRRAGQSKKLALQLRTTVHAGIRHAHSTADERRRTPDGFNPTFAPILGGLERQETSRLIDALRLEGFAGI